MRRLLDCPGSAHLTAAIAALRSQNLQVDRYLFSGWAPRDRFGAFAAEIATMADQLQAGLQGTAITPEQFTAWLNQNLDAGDRQQIRQHIGLETVDELWLATGWRPKEQLLRQLYPSARCICYGDGLGLYTPANSVLNQRRGWRSRLKHWLQPQARLPLPDRGFFAFAGDQSLDFPSQAVPLSLLWQCLQDLAIAIPTEAIAPLQVQLQSQAWGVVLTANLAEQADGAYITPAAEIEAYRQFLAQHNLPPRLLLKPHPRDRSDKVQQLTAAIAQLGVTPVLLQDARLDFWPIEAILLRLATELQGLPVFSVSSAVIPLQALGADIKLGFGAAIVRQQFTHKGYSLRLQEEQRLHQWLEHTSTRDHQDQLQ